MKFELLATATTLAAFAFVGAAHAGVIVSTGAGSAVSSIDRTATFDSVQTFTDLTHYSEDGLSITTPNFDDQISFPGTSGGVFYGSGGQFAPITITTTDARKIKGVEFNVGDGFGNGFGGFSVAFIAYEVLDNGLVVGSGTLSLDPGTVLGFSDATGFDTVLYGAYQDAAIAAAVDANFDNEQNAGALDNVKVQLLASPVPEPETLALFGIGLAGLGVVRRRRRA